MKRAIAIALCAAIAACAHAPVVIEPVLIPTEAALDAGFIRILHPTFADAGALPAGASREEVISVRQGLILLPDAGTAGVLGGVWLSDAKAMALAKERENHKAQLASLKDEPDPLNPALAFGIGIAVGAIAAGFLVAHFGGK